MNTKITVHGLDGFQKSFRLSSLDESSLSIRRVKGILFNVGQAD